MTTITYKKLLLPAVLPAIILASCNREDLDGNDTGSRTPVAATRTATGYTPASRTPLSR